MAMEQGPWFVAGRGISSMSQVAMLAGVAAVVSAVSGGIFLFGAPRTYDAPDLAPAATFIADRSYCADVPEAKSYISQEELVQLRSKFQNGDSIGAFVGLSAEQRAITAEAMRLGSGGPLFASRILRSLNIVEALGHRASCREEAGHCETASTIAYLKTGTTYDPNKDKRWSELYESWKQFRNKDIDAARICMTL
jgi:hypothetical protein